MVRRLLRKLGPGKTSFVIAVISIILSVFIYIVISNLFGKVQVIGIFESVIIPAIVAPLVSYFLLRLLIKLDLAEKALVELNAELELRVEQRTAELVEANEELQAEITERRRAEEQIERRNRELALLNRVIAAATSELEVEKVLEVTCHELALAFDVAEAAAMLLNDERTAVTVVAAYRAEGRLTAMGDVIPLEGNPTAQYIIERRKPLAMANVPDDPRMGALREMAEQHDIASLLVLPLTVRGEVLGFISLVTTERREFSDEEIELASNAVTAVAQVLDNARLFEGERYQREIAETLLEASEAVASLDLGQVLLALARQLLDIGRFHACVISRRGQEEGWVRALVEHARAIWLPGNGDTYHVSDYPVTERVLLTGEPAVVHVGMADEDEAELDLIREQGFSVLLILPLRAGEETIGLVEIGSSEDEFASDGAVVLRCQQVLREAASWLESPLRANSDAALLALAGRLVEASGGSSCSISTWCHLEGKVRTAVEYKDLIWAPDEGPVYHLATSTLSRALKEAKPTVVRLSDSTCGPEDREELAKWGMRTMVIHPLSIRGEPIGLIELHDATEERIVSDHELRLWQAMADQAAIAIENARLYEQAQQEITERVQAEEQIKASLQEKEVLLKEIHHRVKNNLQAIASLLYLQSKNVKDEELLEMFHESRSRIGAMALIHEKLYQSQDLARVDLAEYIRGLADYLFQSYSVSSSVIRLKVDADEASPDIDTAISLGLILHELVSNSLKHAFPDGRGGEVRIEVRSDVDSGLTLMVSDDGVGFPEDLDFRETESLGLQLINSLVARLEGAIELDRSSGTAFKITFTSLE